MTLMNRNATEMVTFHVGKDGADETFTVHKG
jgi:hypothetical protein